MRVKIEVLLLRWGRHPGHDGSCSIHKHAANQPLMNKRLTTARNGALAGVPPYMTICAHERDRRCGEPRPARLNRRAFLGTGAGGRRRALARLDVARAPRREWPVRRPLGGAALNILIVLVDQMRSPCWWPRRRRRSRAAIAEPRAAAARERCRSGAITRPPTTARPSRAALLTGLHTHQDGLPDNRARSEARSRIFRPSAGCCADQGYQTWWYGKCGICRAARRSSRGASRERDVPLARRRARTGPRGRPADRGAIRRVVRRSTWSGRARGGDDGVLSSTPTTSRGGTATRTFVVAEASVQALCRQLPP